MCWAGWASSVRGVGPPLGPQEARPSDRAASWRGLDAGVLEDLPDGGGGDGDAESRQLAVDPPVTPCRILPGEAQNQGLDVPVGAGRPCFDGTSSPSGAAAGRGA